MKHHVDHVRINFLRRLNHIHLIYASVSSRDCGRPKLPHGGFDLRVWSQRSRATGSAGAKPMGRRQPRSLQTERDWLMARLATVAGLTLRALLGYASVAW
jgi:hypothetical protein